MKIDSGNPWSLVARGLVAFYFDWDFHKSEQCFKEALDKNNSMANACLYLSWIYAMQGNTGKMLDILKTAHRLDPLGGDTLAGASEVCFITGLLNESEHYAQEALANDGHNIYAASILAQVVGFKGDWQRAEEMMRPVYQLVPDFKLVATFTGIVLAKNGKKEEARDLAENLEKMHHQPGMPALDGLLSLIYLALGDKEKFYNYYEQALQKKIVTSLYYYGSPFMEEVREEERLKKLLRGIHPLVR
jgi:tetratricopeptide (TPR) repeat protein